MKQYNTGDFNKKIKIQESTPVTNENGFTTSTWNDILNPYSKVENTSGNRFFGANKDDIKNVSKFIIRYRSVLNNKKWDELQVVYKNVTYKVNYINNIDEKNVFQEIIGEAVR